MFLLLVFLRNSHLEAKMLEAIVALNSPRKLGLTGAVNAFRAFVEDVFVFLFSDFHISQVGAGGARVVFLTFFWIHYLR